MRRMCIAKTVSGGEGIGENREARVADSIRFPVSKARERKPADKVCGSTGREPR